MKDMHDPSDMTATELDPTEDEMALGIVAVRVVEWGPSTTVLLRHKSGFTATGTASSRPGKEPNPYGLEVARGRASGALKKFAPKPRPTP